MVWIVTALLIIYFCFIIYCIASFDNEGYGLFDYIQSFFFLIVLSPIFIPYIIYATINSIFEKITGKDDGTLI